MNEATYIAITFILLPTIMAASLLFTIGTIYLGKAIGAYMQSQKQTRKRLLQLEQSQAFVARSGKKGSGLTLIRTKKPGDWN